MSRTIEIADDAAASSWTALTTIPWDKAQFGGAAHDGEVGTQSGFDLDDDTAAETLPVKRLMRVIETATTPDTVLFKGRISDKRLARGTRHDGDARKFDVTVDDNNSQLFGIPIDNWVRGSETARARARAALLAFGAGSPRASTDLDRTTYIPNTNTVVMPAKTYFATDLGGVLRECADTEGKQLFVTDDDEVFLDKDTSVAYAASLSITDDSPNLTTEFPPIDPSGSQQGNEFFSGATVKYGASSSVDDVRSSAETDHDYWRIVIQDGDADSTMATARLATLLDNQSVEEESFDCAIQLTDAKVDLIKRGHTVSFRSAGAGVLTPRTLRVASLLWELVAPATGGQPGIYLAHLELGVRKKIHAARVRRVKNQSPGPGGNPSGGECCPPWDGIGSPATGQEVLQEFVAAGDGATTAWVAPFPYLAGSLRVYFNTKNVTSTKTEVDPTTGDFSVSTAPTASPLQNVYVSFYAA